MQTPSCTRHAHPHQHARWLPRLDAFASVASLVCALHCAFLPMAAVAMPLATVEVLGNHELEHGFVVLALLFGAIVLSMGLSQRSRYPVAAMFIASAVLLISGTSSHGQVLLHAVLMTLGGLSLGLAHALNRHSARAYGDARPLWRQLRVAALAHSASTKPID